MEKRRLPVKFWSSIENRISFFKVLAKRLGVEKWEDWYNINKNDFSKNGGRGLITYFGSHVTAITTTLSEYPWQKWKFIQVSPQYWQKVEHQREFLIDLSKKLNIKQPDDWYAITQKDIISHGGKGLLNIFHGSPSLTIMSAFKEYNLKPWLFSTVPHGFWDSISNQILFIEDLAKKIGMSKKEEFHNITRTDVVNHGGKVLLEKYGNMLNLLQHLFPDIKWKGYKLKSIPDGYWKKVENQKEFLLDLGKHLQFTHWEQWYNIKAQDILQFEGTGILELYNFSPSKVITSVFKEDYNWDISKFSRRIEWDDISNRREFFLNLGKKLNIKEMEDWYTITSEHILKENGGYGIMEYFHYSPSTAVINTFPEFSWKVWKFKTVPNNYWDDINHCKTAIEDIGKILGIQTLSDWFDVSIKQIEQYGLSSLVSKYRGLIPTLMNIYPEYPWELEKTVSKTKAQRYLHKLILEIFPNRTDIFLEYMHSELLFKSGKPMQLDIFIPSLNLAFEYQGEQHFRETKHFASLDQTQTLDEEKREACTKAKITLIEVPFWWDNTKESLLATIHSIRPELCEPGNGKSIPIGAIFPKKNKKM